MINDFLESGIIERYCLNEINSAEKEVVEKMAKLFPIISEAINLFKKEKEVTVIKPNALSKIKYNIMREIYRSCSIKDSNFVPLISAETQPQTLYNFVKKNNLPATCLFEGNIKVLPLASTIEIQNTAIWIKGNAIEEIHFTEDEFIFVVKGSCIMNFGGEKKTYHQGELIYIPPNVPHSSEIISATPMFALVQRQLLAQA